MTIKEVAEMIQQLTGADLFKIEPASDYPYHYQECCDLAKEELENNVKPEIKHQINNIENYDVIYIGGPVWWYTICPVVTTFLKQYNYNLSGKKVYLFATNAEWLGHTFQDFEKLCENGSSKDCLNVVFDSNKLSQLKTEESEIDNWIKNI